MLENARVIKDFIVADLKNASLRKEYGYGNEKHSVVESRAKIYNRMQELSKALVKSTEMDLQVIGRENLPSEGPVLYVATHKSVFDIVILLTLIDSPTLFIGKKEVADMPFVHKWFDALGCIYIDREDKKQALKSIMQGIQELRNGQSIVLFPEGTRNMSNEINHFKEAGFRLATKSQVPIVPIALSNTYKIFEEKKRIQKTKVVVHIGQAIETKDLTKEELTSLPANVEDCVKKLMASII